MKQILVFLAIIIYPFFLSAQLSPVPESNLTLTEFSEKGEVITIQAFSISELITVREFKEYLNALRSNSEATYLRQLPKSKDLPANLIQNFLNEDKYQDLPMPGVSWEVARNYCIWLSDKGRKKGETDVFDLPLVGEVLAYEQIYKTNKSPVLAYWTKNTYDESFLDYKDKLAYQYEARESDPPSLKRKVIWNSPNCLNCNLENMQYEYQDSSSRYVGFRIVKRNKWLKSEQIIIEKTRINFQTFQNNLTGIYEENNSQHKVLGAFSNGQRTGLWTVWDSLGNVLIQRNYQNNRIVDFLIPSIENPYKELYNNYPNNIITKNESGFYPFERIEEKNVCFSIRAWKQLNQETDPELFSEINFRKVIKELLTDKERWYIYSRFGDFFDKYRLDSLTNFENEYKSWDLSRIEIKEDFFVNSESLISETRLVGIAFYKNKTDSIPSFLFYYPHIRDQLALFNFELSSNDQVNTLDDYLFFNAYRGKHIYELKKDKIIKVESSKEWNKQLYPYLKEHEFWLLFGR